jgi:hypothetical protein
MPSIGFKPEDFFAELEKLGVDEVRVRLATKIYSDVNNKATLAREWLMRKDQSRAAETERKRDDSSAEQIRIARSAKNAAWTAAIAAIVAAIIAAVAAVIAYLAIKPTP